MGHEVPALVPSMGAHIQAAPGDVSHHTGTGAAVPYIGKREANPAINYIYGYKAVTADNGGLKGAVHEVPALVPAMGAHIQAAPGDVSHHTGTGAAVYHIGKREANPACPCFVPACHCLSFVPAFGAHIQAAPGYVSHHTGTGAAVLYIGK